MAIAKFFVILTNTKTPGKVSRFSLEYIWEVHFKSLNLPKNQKNLLEAIPVIYLLSRIYFKRENFWWPDQKQNFQNLVTS